MNNTDSTSCVDECLREDFLDAYHVLICMTRLDSLRIGKTGETHPSDTAKTGQRIVMKEVSRLVARCKENGVEHEEADRLLPLFLNYWEQCHREGLGQSTTAQSEEKAATIESFLKYLIGSADIRPNLECFFSLSNKTE